MSPDAMIPVLLIVAFLVSLVMAGVARQKVPGSGEYREHAPSGRGWGERHGHDARPYGRAESWPRRDDRYGGGLGRGYGRTGEADHVRRDRPRYHANGSSAQGRHDPFEHAPDNGFEAWARANGFRWRDASQEPPAPPPPRTPHWSKVLNVPRTAGVGEIRKAYASTMRRLHPDVAGQNELTSQRCTEARVAYEQARRDAQEAGRA